MLDPRAIQDLSTRIDAQFPAGRGRLVGFIASDTGEGTTTIAQSYARMVSTHLRRRVLCLDAGADPEASGASLAGALHALSGRAAVDSILQSLGDEAATDSAMRPGADISLWELLPRTELWYALRERYDEIVIDLPAASVSRMGMAVAPYCDGVAVVVEAEKTRSPVARNLVHQLHSVRARVLGAVLNRRRFHLPARLYRML